MKLHLLKDPKHNFITCGGCGLRLTPETEHDVNECVKKLERA